MTNAPCRSLFCCFGAPEKSQTFWGEEKHMKQSSAKATAFCFDCEMCLDETRLARRKLKFATTRTRAPQQSTGLLLFGKPNCPVRASYYITNKKNRPDGSVLFVGADDEARTRYLNLGKVALYRVSYIRKCKSNYTYYTGFCQGFFKNKNVYKL